MNNLWFYNLFKHSNITPVLSRVEGLVNYKSADSDSLKHQMTAILTSKFVKLDHKTADEALKLLWAAPVHNLSLAFS